MVEMTEMSDYEEGVEMIGDGIRHRVPPAGAPDADSLSLNSEAPALHEVKVHKKLLENDNASDLVEEERGTGCPLPSTPVDFVSLEREMLQSGVGEVGDNIDSTEDRAQNENMSYKAWSCKAAKAAWTASWNVCHFHHLPQWLQDNDFLHSGHRPPLNSFNACFKSIFRIHTETGNIWTHLLGCIAFMGTMTYFLTRPPYETKPDDKIVFSMYFIGAIICLGCSFAFHTLHCHSENIGKLFSKLDYCGIAILIMGSFVPWLYYGFYCHFYPKIIYMSMVMALGIMAMIVSLGDKFSSPSLRSVRAGVFAAFGLSGIIPAIHYGYTEGWFNKVAQAYLGWLLLMGVLYILGALFYAMRVPERFFPGKCDIWFQSHQIFHVLVIAAAFVHYHGVSEMAVYRTTMGECRAQSAIY
ncbi:adiponectin receptor protein isoform X3 [Bemisia tabaci]|uniref:adiponectin receptor protein isoform X3 n=1 Tax=Bemisia tabaci TaxID=7038 RepID=UPI003B27CEA6